MISPEIPSPSTNAREEAQARFDALAKPLGSLGRIEEVGAFIAATQGKCPPDPLTNVRAVVLAGDHAVTASGVAAYPSAVTIAMVNEIAAGRAGVSVLARQHDVSLRVLDISVDVEAGTFADGIDAHKLARSCRPIDTADAMTDDELAAALETGARITTEEVAAGAQLLIVGDLGIGNTTPSAALVGAQLGLPAAQVTGRGAGLDDAAYAGKIEVVQRIIDRVADDQSAQERLRRIGSPDIAVGVGIMIAAARAGVPLLLDGNIATTEALYAEALAPGVRAWCLAGHRSPEPSLSRSLAALQITPLLDLGMRLGEGSGAIAALPLVRSSVLLMREMALLADALG
ncbi:nicotinate-nucleotide--dimethylbenzimidazole phosphoribosyltransferase [Blastococcus sp. Marseille-P5729]|uniref:nicotinate-nucleotide--dimethylbenzimidazole phosphoribosyltransferase n=1 Tax=Blastococcus sp. Marseille-P5729 TaxID=2086582 RepID=UPI000D0E7AE3|nr:nicotinate-nucleotide--dimethylbenzimidazole phosphoribosyltransferase [Blastococcus sp. Marseille-P5729]